MLNNKKGLSAIVLTIIMVGLVLVAVGIVWAVILNVLEGQSESLDVSQECVGIIIKPTALDCEGSTCNVTLERGLGSSGDAVDGVGITLSSDTDSEGEEEISGNVAATRTVEVALSNLAAGDVTSASVRVYFTIDGENRFCSQVSTYP